MRKKIVAANWKMNTTLNEGIKLAFEIAQKVQSSMGENLLTIICPPLTHLRHVHEVITDNSYIHLGAQNCHWEDEGAFTGEISAKMLKSIGTQYVIIGHSERRQFFRETHEQLAKKTNAALNHGLKVIFCCGENLKEREDGKQEGTVEKQLRESLWHLYEEQFEDVVIAYEPVWAIGTGKVASPAQVQKMHHFIRNLLSKQLSEKIAQEITILYGGSVKPDNAKELFQQEDVDGGLIGGASLKADDFAAICSAMPDK